ncbi:MAG: GxGYxYP family putative glycoside hydrolase [Opitutaceae bacterium]|nr:GxGYxYP family putative glycoside hydrolase [Opitutaceae bacterium]
MLVALCLAEAAAAERTILPKPPPLNPKLTVCDVSGRPGDLLFFTSIQGVVNQEDPCLYLITEQQSDPVWLDWIVKRGYVKEVTPVAPDDLVKTFRSRLQGAVVYDPALPASINVATMIAGLEQLAVIPPGMIGTCGLPVKEDLRGRFTDNPTAYAWAIEHLMPRLSKDAMSSQFPTRPNTRDYLIQNRIFTFWVTAPGDKEKTGASPKEREVIERAFALTKPQAPVTGFWYTDEENKGINEYYGVMSAGEFGKCTVVDPLSTNNSIHAAIRVDPEVFRQRRPPLAQLDPGKVYVAVSIIESGDAPFYWSTRQKTVWDDPNRGQVPISWCIGPATLDTRPDILEWYYRNATPNDYFFTALSGAAYIMPIYFAKKDSDPEAAWDGFLGLTDRYMEKLDLDMVSLHMDSWAVSPTHYDDSLIFKRYAERLPRLRTILSDFGKMEDLNLARANHWVAGRDVTVFHCLNRWLFEGINEHQPEWLANEIRKVTPKERPGFMFVMALSWSYTPTDILKAKEILGPKYEFVTVRDLDHLFRLTHPRPGEKAE